MNTLTIHELVKATKGRLLQGDENCEIFAIETDSRRAGKDTLFVPLVGNRDGHDFIDKAIENGVSAVVTHKQIDVPDSVCVIEVSDTRVAFGDIAKYYKSRLNLKTVAILGSVGKTTTKDMVAGVLATQFKTLKTKANFNNDIGLPLTIFNLEDDHEVAVLEMGMNHFGEIRYLANIGMPDIAVLTNIGVSHIENLGSRENIMKAKLEVTENFGKENTLIVNGDNDLLSTIRDQKPIYRTIYYGEQNPSNDLVALNIEDKGLYGLEFDAKTSRDEYHIKLSVPGRHNVYNALSAIAVGELLGVSKENIIKGLEQFELTENRLQVEKVRGITLINDCYNAAPDSIKSALEMMKKTDAKRRVAILGDVFELGEHSEEQHRKIGRFVAENNIDVLICAGEAMNYAFAEASTVRERFHFDTTEEAASFARGFVKEGDLVLIKASHGMEFFKVYEELKK